MIRYENEEIDFEKINDNILSIKLPELTEDEKNIIDPIVAPTSGLRIQIYDVVDEQQRYLLPRRKLFLFFRVFKAISHLFKELKEGNDLKILIVTDNRPSKDLLLDYCSGIFAYEGYEIYHQTDVPGESKASSPYLSITANAKLVTIQDFVRSSPPKPLRNPIMCE